MIESSSDIPVLVLFFNRKDTVLRLISELSIIQPRELFLSSDGGRTDQERLKVAEIRELVIKAVNWECRVVTRFGVENLGCKQAVHAGVQWFFENVPEGIVLEDDCIPSTEFFHFALEMLNEHRNNIAISSIGARNEFEKFAPGQTVLSSKFFCWGWASWANRIVGLDVECGYSYDLPKSIYSELGFFESRHVRGMRNLMKLNLVDSWAYAYDFNFRKSEQRQILPPFNYVENIAINGGTHSTNRIKSDELKRSEVSVIKVNSLSSPQEQPQLLETYLFRKYGFVKLMLFPWIGVLKTLLKRFK